MESCDIIFLPFLSNFPESSTTFSMLRGSTVVTKTNLETESGEFVVVLE